MIEYNNKARIEDRVMVNAKCILEEGATVRSCAVKSMCSKSTVYKDLVDRLPDLDRELYNRVHKVLVFNKQVRCTRGGQATKKLFERISKSKEGIVNEEIYTL